MILFLVVLALWITFLLLGGGAVLARPDLSRLGGFAGLVTGVLAVYGSFAITTNTTFGRTVLPVGARK